MPQAEPGKRVLVVDDEPEVREALKRILQKEHYEVEAAADGLEARDLVASRSFNLVITDLIMPGMDGLALLTHLRQACPDTRVMIMTAYGGWDSYLDAMNSGAFNYVTKPIKKDELLRLVRNALMPDPDDAPEADPDAPGAGHGDIPRG